VLYRCIGKKQFRSLVEMFLDTCEVIGPKLVTTAPSEKAIHHYTPVTSFNELDLTYETTEYSAKQWLLPFTETLSDFQFDDEDWSQTIDYDRDPRVVVGLHACDINGLLKLDKVFARDFFPSPHYISRRRNTFIIGIDHDPCEGGFCRSLGTDTATHGFDLFLTDLGDRFFVAVGSDRGFGALQRVGAREITDEDTHDYLVERQRIAAIAQETVSVHDLPKLLDIEFTSEVWHRWGDKCMSCGSCAMVCPTCYCYGVMELVSMDFKQGIKQRQAYSCNIVDFAEVAGGQNFRPDRETRLKYRYYHQHRGFAEIYDEPKCVGCNRCGRTCLAGISPVKVIRDLQMDERT
jgi:sulfhydrogenase subunit beta (sulfur reductase)